LTDVRGYGLVEAVSALLGEKSLKMAEPRVPTVRRPFALPRRCENNNRAIAYLQSRGIEKQLILGCAQWGQIYERAVYHDCVFVGRDEGGKARYACIRGTAGSFRRDVEGSDKRYGFTLPPNTPNSCEIAVFESPIDALSHQTLYPDFGGWRLSLGGTSLLALEQFLQTHPHVTQCLVCTDNDEAGWLAAARIAQLPGLATERSPPPAGKDWNDALMSEKTQNRVRQAPCL